MSEVIMYVCDVQCINLPYQFTWWSTFFSSYMWSLHGTPYHWSINLLRDFAYRNFVKILKIFALAALFVASTGAFWWMSSAYGRVACSYAATLPQVESSWYVSYFSDMATIYSWKYQLVTQRLSSPNTWCVRLWQNNYVDIPSVVTESYCTCNCC